MALLRDIRPNPTAAFNRVTGHRNGITASKWLPAGFSLTFFCLGYLFLKYPGLQSDEVLAVNPLFRITDALWFGSIGRRNVPVMVMTYLGALKTWLYVPVFRTFLPSTLSIRLPALILGSAAIWVCFVLLLKIHSRRAALLGTALVATDSTFLLTTCFDWDPWFCSIFLGCLG
ncbi:MAG: hypothetical protein JO022_13070 [Acidobacteriaceae bacterium]|nr:hypothetical protein [Acidobacteriaceae bacterium]